MRTLNCAVVALALVPYSVLAAGVFPTHCKANEHAYLNAQMATVTYLKDGSYKLTKNGKILSLCSEGQSEPLESMVYRYGPVGKVEMERVASRKSRFQVYSRSTSPHTGEKLVYFSVGKFTYYVTQATGQGTGISLVVFDAGKKVADLFSGNNEGVDYQSELNDLNFDKPSSPIFIRRKPVDDPEE